MSLSRRRFLTICAAALSLGPAATLAAPPLRWRGLALGAEAEITLRGDREHAGRALRDAKRELRRIERLFSLYDPDSALSQLNAAGRLDPADQDFLDLLHVCDRVHGLTGGLFDPSVQPLWRLLARAGALPPTADLERARALVDWRAVSFGESGIVLDRPGMALTLNGIAQGYATDRVTAVLAEAGYAASLVNIGEFRAGDGAWRVGVADPRQGLVATQELSQAAVATSSPGALSLLGGDQTVGHILRPDRPLGAALWSTVSVTARNATLADGLSTAMTFMTSEAIEEIAAKEPDLLGVLLVSRDGSLERL